VYRIVQAVRQTDLASVLEDINSWLERYGCGLIFPIIERETLDIVTIQIDLNCLELAEAFTRAFQGLGLFPAIVSVLG
jgi:hypothetical protein